MKVVAARSSVAEFFAGIGLVRMGLENAGAEVIFANDIDPKKLEMYRHQFPNADAHFVLGDIKALDPDTVPPVDIATASFPCTDLSLAGAREGLRGAQSSAFWSFIDVVTAMRQRPKVILLENVTGFLTSHGGSDFASAMHALNQLGYSVDPLVIDAAWFVPQSRQRLFVIAVRNEFVGIRETRKSFGFYESRVRPSSVAEFMFLHPEIRWHSHELPDPPQRECSLDDVVEDLPDDSPEWWGHDRTSYLLNQMSERHRIQADRLTVGSRWSYGTVFRRVRNGRSMAELRLDGLAGCLRTPKGGSGRQILMRFGFNDARARLVNPRECARLMGADNFKISVPVNQALFGFGDAVCVPAITWLAKNYLLPVVADQPLALAYP